MGKSESIFVIPLHSQTFYAGLILNAHVKNTKLIEREIIKQISTQEWSDYVTKTIKGASHADSNYSFVLQKSTTDRRGIQSEDVQR